MFRPHAYLHQYNDREMAESVYANLGYTPSDRCEDCGQCRKACPSSIDLPRAIREVAQAMA